MKRSGIVFGSVVWLMVLNAHAGAQVPNASAAALGMAENYPAGARGANAVAWNPAVLGLSDRPGYSVLGLTLRFGTGIGPVGLSDLSDHANTVVPGSVRDDWQARIVEAGGQGGAAEVEGSFAAVQIGPVALQTGSTVHARTRLSPGIAELVMFGNVRNGVAQDIDLGGSMLDVAAYTSLAASFGMPVPIANGEFAVGATFTYTMGHVLVSGAGSRGAASSDPLSASLDFPLIETDFDRGETNNGSGVGVDVGATLRRDAWTVAVVVRNLLSTFSWDEAKLRYRPLSLELDEEDSMTQTDTEPLSSAPANVRDRVDALGFKPLLGAGVAHAADARTTLTADLRLGSSSGLSAGAPFHAGIGAEHQASPFLPLRAGVARVSLGDGDSGWQLGGGLGIQLGAYALGAGVLYRDTALSGSVTSVLVSLASFGLN